MRPELLLGNVVGSGGPELDAWEARVHRRRTCRVSADLVPTRATFAPGEPVVLEWTGGRAPARVVVTRLGDVVREERVDPVRLSSTSGAAGRRVRRTACCPRTAAPR